MSKIPEAAIEAAAKAMHRYDVSVGLATFVIPTRHHKEEARAAVEAALPFLAREARAEDPMAKIGREHWVEQWQHPTYASAVRCMKPGCHWEGNFPGDIADHVADELRKAGYGPVHEAWDEGFTAGAGEHMKQRHDPTHPITRINPYQSTRAGEV